MKNLFCDYCGRIMKIEGNEKKMFRCICGFTREAELITSEPKMPVKIIGDGIVDGKKKPVNFPHICPKCNHEGCEVIDLGAHYSDESNVYLYICDKCGYVDRQADGSSNG